MAFGQAHFLQDEPVEVDDEPLRLIGMLQHVAERANEELVLVSPYLIPTPELLEHIALETGDGVRVKLLTASMGANNHTVAHSHYKKYRRRLLGKGADLYEFRHDPSAELRDKSDVPPVQARFIALHTKAVIADRSRCFVGSLNLDPRALRINTENGLYIDSPEFCELLAERFERMMQPENAWRVYLDEKGRLRWTSTAGTVTRQPARSFGQRVADFFFRLLPLEGQL